MEIELSFDESNKDSLSQSVIEIVKMLIQQSIHVAVSSCLFSDRQLR
jgi:hypothetical protein